MSANDDKIRLIADAAARSQRYLAAADSTPVFPSDEAIAALSQFSESLPSGPANPDLVLAQLDELGSPASVRTTKGRYFGFVQGNSEPIGTAAMILSTTWDQNLGMPVAAPGAAHLDSIAARWVCELLGLPASAIATFCGGASIANLTGVLAARDALLDRAGWDVCADGLHGAPAIRVVTSAEIHASVMKALRLAGIGTNAITKVATDELGRLRADDFPETDSMTLVVLQAGNVNTGHSDPFGQIIPRVQRAGGWVHVDGAFGLWAAASPRHTEDVRGSQLADSWAIDAHKWLNAPYDSGIAICRRVEDLRRAMTTNASYLSTTADRTLLQLGLQMSQRARAIETWAIIATKGRTGVAEMVDQLCELAQRMAAKLSHGGAKQLVPVGLNQMLFSFGSDAETDRVIEAVQSDRTCWVGGTEWQGQRAMRISVCDSSMTTTDIDQSADAILRCCHSIRAQSAAT
ncbi:MAG: aspartate aminotransferase family protein [Planctomycetaceae bacterium]